MAFAASGLRRMAYGGFLASAGDQPTCHWGYKTNDTAATVEGSGYFDAAYQRLKALDIIDAILDADGTPAHKRYLVTASASDGVTISAYQGAALSSLTDNSDGNAAATAIAAGAGTYTVALFLDLADIADGDLITTYVPGHRFQVNKVDFRVGKAVTTAAKAADINLEIGTTNLTGGVVGLTSANCTPKGAAVAGSAVTGNNVGTATDAISVEAANTTAFAEGTGWLLISITNLDTADALAALNAALEA